MFLAWKNHPMTIRVFEWAKERRESRKEMWANGNFSSQFSDELMIRNASAVGYCSGMQEFLELKYEDFGDSDE